MMLGLSLSTFTTVHTLISLMGILCGAILVAAMIFGRKTPGWAALFIATNIATSVTGFMFPLTKVGPPHIVGVIALITLALCSYALYTKKLAGAWRAVYVATAVFAIYLNAFVGVVQAFQKIGFFKALAPTQKELPFLIAQGLTLAIFVFAGRLALRHYPKLSVLRQPIPSLARA